MQTHFWHFGGIFFLNSITRQFNLQKVPPSFEPVSVFASAAV